MSPGELTALIFGVMFALMIVRIPIAVAMFVAGCVGYFVQVGWLPLASFLSTQAFARFASFELSVIPLFILMGAFATQGGLSKALFEFAAAVTARFRGGLAMGATGASAAFGAICGSAVATAATITQVALPELRRNGYRDRIATGTLAAGGTLGILIPPSVPLLIYAILTEQNIAKLFAAAMIPGLLALVGYIVAIAVYVRLAPEQAPARSDQLPRVTRQVVTAVLPIIVIFLVVFGGIYGGYFSPTEGAAIGAAATFTTALLRREMTLARMAQAFYTTAAATAMVFFIFLGADIMNSALALTQVPVQLARWVDGLGWEPLTVLALILAFYIVAGFFMDELAVMLLTIPIVFPTIMALDLGLPPEHVAIWFGILLLMTVSFGLLSPPVGLIVYVVNGMARNVPIVESYRGVVPFLCADLVRLALLFSFPGITLWVLQFFG